MHSHNAEVAFFILYCHTPFNNTNHRSDLTLTGQGGA